MQTSRLFTVGEGYKALVLLFRTAGKTSKARKQGLLDKHFMERIMLGVTQVMGVPSVPMPTLKWPLKWACKKSR